MASGNGFEENMQIEVKTEDGTLLIEVFNDETINPAGSTPLPEGFVIKAELQDDFCEYAADDKGAIVPVEQPLVQPAANSGCKCDVCRLKIPADDTTDQSLCVVCGKTFPSESCLAYHEQVGHDPEQENADDAEVDSSAGFGNGTELLKYASDVAFTDQDKDGIGFASSNACGIPGSTQSDQQQLTNFDMDLDEVLPGFAIMVGTQEAIKTEEVHIVSELPVAAAAAGSGLRVKKKFAKNVTGAKTFHPQETVLRVANELLQKYVRSIFAEYYPTESALEVQTEAPMQDVLKAEELHMISELPTEETPSSATEITDATNNSPIRRTMQDDKTRSTDKNVCFICGHEFRDNHRLRLHLCTMHKKPRRKNMVEQNLSRCYLCQPIAELANNVSLEQHLEAAHPNPEPYTCHECNIMIHGSVLINLHRSRHDDMLWPYGCAVCPVRFAKPVVRDIHEKIKHMIKSKNNKEQVNVHNVQNGYRTTQTAQAKATQSALGNQTSNTDDIAHRRRMHNAQPIENVCSVLQRLPSGITWQSRVVETLFKCYICSGSPLARFDEKASLDKHLATTHPQSSWYHCAECNRTILETIAFNEHLSRHDPANSSVPYKCTFCSLRFSSRNSQFHHEAEVHAELRANTYTCPVCQNSFSCEGGLKPHRCTALSEQWQGVEPDADLHPNNQVTS